MKQVLKLFKPFILGKCSCGCNGDIPITVYKKHLRRYNQNHNVRSYKDGYYKRGRYKDSRGYWIVKDWNHPYHDSRGYVKEHRLIYEHYLKILFCHDMFIPSNYDIHHINKKRDDNRLINLTILEHEEHKKFHRKPDYSNRKCLLCNSFATYIYKRNNKPQWYRYLNNFICSKCKGRLTRMERFKRNPVL